MSMMPKQSRYLIIVRRDRPDLRDHLRQVVGEEDIEILLDRRGGQATFVGDASWDDRRRPVGFDNDVLARQYLIISRKEERSGTAVL
jgi:hypothetical protein